MTGVGNVAGYVEGGLAPDGVADPCLGVDGQPLWSEPGSAVGGVEPGPAVLEMKKRLEGCAS